MGGISNDFEIRKNKIVLKTNMYYKIYSIDGKLISRGLFN